MTKQGLIQSSVSGDEIITVMYEGNGHQVNLDKKMFERDLSHEIRDYIWVSGSKENERWFKDLQHNNGKKFKGSSSRDVNKFFKDKNQDSFSFDKTQLEEIR